MPQFLAEELRNFSSKGWLGINGTGNRDTAPDNLTWYEETATNDVIIKPSQVWGDFSSIPPAVNQAAAQTNALTYPSLIQDYTLVGTAIHMTPNLSGKAFYATSTYGDLTTRLRNWIMPQLVPRTDAPFVGFPSIGYMVRIFNGDPDLGGSTEILTSQDQVGGIVGWFFTFGAGMMITSSTFSAIADPTDVWCQGFRYIGAEGGGGGGSGSASLIADKIVTDEIWFDQVQPDMGYEGNHVQTVVIDEDGFVVTED